MPAVTIVLLNDDPSPLAIEDAVVEFYSTGGVFQTGGTTDDDGEVTVTLPIGFYDVLFYKVGVSILPRQPQRIEVIDPGVNVFEVVGHERAQPESIDPLRCTVSGFMYGSGGLGTKTKMSFATSKALLVLSGNVIAPGHQVNVSSDEEGHFEFELLRNTAYKAYFTYVETLFGMTPGVLDIMVPDAPAVSLHDLLFPVPVGLSFSATTITLVAGADPDSSIEYTLTHTDGSSRTASTPWAGVTLTNSDNLVVEAAMVDGVLVLTPLTAGTAIITTIRTMGSTVVIDPVPSYVTNTVTVTVTA